MLADLITSVAHQFNVSIPAKEAHVAAVAGSVLIRSMRADEKLLLGDRARRTVAIDTDGAWASATLMSKWRQVGEWMAQHTMSLGHGHISFLHFAYATSPLALQEHVRNTSSLVRAGCLDPRADTYSPAGTMHRPAACMYATNPAAKAFLQMDEVEWLYFGLTLLSSIWLITILCGVIAHVWRFRKLRQLSRTPLETWPKCCIIVPCYLPNEQDIIMETVSHMCAVEYPGELRVIVVYNTPEALPVEKELQALGTLNGRTVCAFNVPGSQSKAHNLEFALTEVTEKVVVLFDADHHPNPDCVNILVSTLQRMPNVCAVQGAVLINRGGPWLMRFILNGMEWSSWCIWGPGIAEVAGSGYFGGACAAWRPDTLRTLGFDTVMQTEDIDLSIRACSKGHTIQMMPLAQSLEMCPVGMRALYRQRLRWALGWEEVTRVRMAAVFGSPDIQEPRKWRLFLFLMARYFTLFTSLFGIAQIIESILHSRDWPIPLRIAMTIPSVICYIVAFVTVYMLFQLRAKPPLWLSVLVFQLASPVFFFVQSSLIIVATIKLTLRGSKPIEWVATKRDPKAVPQKES